jgi:hypothetical protein
MRGTLSIAWSREWRLRLRRCNGSAVKTRSWWTEFRKHDRWIANGLMLLVLLLPPWEMLSPRRAPGEVIPGNGAD